MKFKIRKLLDQSDGRCIGGLLVVKKVIDWFVNWVLKKGMFDLAFFVVYFVKVVKGNF